MMLFSKRLRLAKMFEEHAKRHLATVEPLNVITWLYVNGLLNEDKVERFLEKENKDE